MECKLSISKIKTAADNPEHLINNVANIPVLTKSFYRNKREKNFSHSDFKSHPVKRFTNIKSGVAIPWANIAPIVISLLHTLIEKAPNKLKQYKKLL